MLAILKKAFLAAGFAAVSLIGVGGAAHATTCGPFIMTGVTPNIGCEIGSYHNDSEAQLDADTLFDLTGWMQIAKDDGPDGTVNSGNPLAMSVSGSGQAGTVTISEFVFDMYENVVVVLKGAANNVDPDDYVGFLVESDGDGDSIFDYITVFLSTQGQVGNPQNVSHISLYGQGLIDTPEVPLPAAAWMLLAGLLGLGGLRLRRG